MARGEGLHHAPHQSSEKEGSSNVEVFGAARRDQGLRGG